MNLVKKQIFIQYFLNQDIRGFGLHLAGLEDIVNFLLRLRGGQPVDKH